MSRQIAFLAMIATDSLDPSPEYAAFWLFDDLENFIQKHLDKYGQDAPYWFEEYGADTYDNLYCLEQAGIKFRWIDGAFEWNSNGESIRHVDFESGVKLAANKFKDKGF